MNSMCALSDAWITRQIILPMFPNVVMTIRISGTATISRATRSSRKVTKYTTRFSRSSVREIVVVFNSCRYLGRRVRLFLTNHGGWKRHFVSGWTVASTFERRSQQGSKFRPKTRVLWFIPSWTRRSQAKTM